MFTQAYYEWPGFSFPGNHGLSIDPTLCYFGKETWLRNNHGLIIMSHCQSSLVIETMANHQWSLANRQWSLANHHKPSLVVPKPWLVITKPWRIIHHWSSINGVAWGLPVHRHPEYQRNGAALPFGGLVMRHGQLGGWPKKSSTDQTTKRPRNAKQLPVATSVLKHAYKQRHGFVFFLVMDRDDQWYFTIVMISVSNDSHCSYCSSADNEWKRMVVHDLISSRIDH